MLCSVCHILNGAEEKAHATVEPSLPRKKKHPEFAYRTHELLFDYEEGECSDSQEIVTGSHPDPDSRARSEERNAGRNRASPRSRSADSSISRRLRTAPVPDEVNKPSDKGSDEKDSEGKRTGEKQPLMTQSYPPSGATKGNPGTPPPQDQDDVAKTTEYRSQFVAWPKRLQQEETGISTTARKSASMGVIASQVMKKDVIDGDMSANEVTSGKADETDDDDAALDAVKRGRVKKTEYKAKFRPFSAYTYVDGSWKKATRLIKDGTEDDMTIYTSFSFPSFVDADFSDNEVPSDMDSHAWYSEVVERLKKADQYRVRSHGAVPFYGSADQPLPPELAAHVKDRSILSPVSLSSTSRTWKDERLVKEKARTPLVPVHHARKEKKEPTDSSDQSKGSPKKKAAVEKTTVRPKSAEPVIPAGKGENRSPKRTRPRAPKDLPVHGHGDLSGRKKASKHGASSPHGKGSPMESKPRPVPRPHAAVNGEDGKVWLKPVGKDEEEDKDQKKEEEEETMVNGYPEDTGKLDRPLVNGESEGPDSVQDSKINGHEEPGIPAAVTKPPMRVPLTTVKSPEEVTGVRSPDPESWTVPLEIGKGLQWMDGKTPDGGQTKVPTNLSKRLKESSLVGPGQKEHFVCDSGSASGGESVDL